MTISPPAWKKSPLANLTRKGLTKRRWLIDLDKHLEETGVEVEPSDLFDPHFWSAVPRRQLHDRSRLIPSLEEGDKVRVIRMEGDDPFDIDLCVRASLPGFIVMELLGARTDWRRVGDAEKTARAQRQQEAMASAAAVVEGDAA